MVSKGAAKNLLQLKNHPSVAMKCRHLPASRQVWRLVHKSESRLKRARCRPKGSVLEVFENNPAYDDEKPTKRPVSMNMSREVRQPRLRKQRARDIVQAFEKRMTDRLATRNDLAEPYLSEPRAAAPAPQNTKKTIRSKDFNSFKGDGIYYGSVVALELVSEGTWLTVGHNRFETRSRKRKGKRVFKLVNLRDPKNEGPVNFGDEVWLCYKKDCQSKVVGTRMRAAINLIEDDQNINKQMGTAVPLDAFLLKSHEYNSDVLARALEVNKKPLVIAQWRIRRVTNPQQEDVEDEANKKHKEQISNLCEIRVEHDWCYLAAQKGRDQEVTLRGGSSNPIRSTKALHSNGVWRIHLVQPPKQSKNIFHRRNSVCYQARQQLQRSTNMRNKLPETARAGKYDSFVSRKAELIVRRSRNSQNLLSQIPHRIRDQPMRPHKSDGNEIARRSMRFMPRRVSSSSAFLSFHTRRLTKTSCYRVWARVFAASAGIIAPYSFAVSQALPGRILQKFMAQYPGLAKFIGNILLRFFSPHEDGW